MECSHYHQYDLLVMFLLTSQNVSAVLNKLAFTVNVLIMPQCLSYCADDNVQREHNIQ